MLKKLFGVTGTKNTVPMNPSVQNLSTSLVDDIRGKVSKISEPEIIQISTQILSYADSDGNLDGSSQFKVFDVIIAPILDIDPNSMTHKQQLIVLNTFFRLFDSRIHEMENRETGVGLIDEELISRLMGLLGFGVVVSHIEESNKLMQNGFMYPSYSELMKGYEKLLKKICLIYYREEYQKEFKELPINATMEDILRFLRKLGWNNRQYIKPIEALNAFANDDKHAVGQRGDIKQLQQHNYNGLLSFILDEIESHG